MIAHVNNQSHTKTFGISSNNIHEMLFAILILKRFCNIWKGMKCSNLELRATSLLKPISVSFFTISTDFFA